MDFLYVEGLKSIDQAVEETQQPEKRRKSGDSYRLDKVKMLALFKHIGTNPFLPRDTDIIRIVDRKLKISEFRRGDVRVFWFQDERRRIVMTNGYPKKTREVSEGDLGQARRFQREYYTAKKAGTLKFRER